MYNTKLQLMALVNDPKYCLIALPFPNLGPTNALFAALLCWFGLVGVRVVCLQGWSPTSAVRKCGTMVRFVRYDVSLQLSILRIVIFCAIQQNHHDLLFWCNRSNVEL
jgi:hypothetical protein